MRLKVDNRIRVVLENAAATHHRALVVLVGEKCKDQVVFIHNLLSNTSLQQASVLWCYKKELSLSSNKKKRFRQLQTAIKTGQKDAEEENLFEKFVSTTAIKYTFYKDTYKVMGNTFKMCVLQDFEGVTANTLCRVVESVEGGGAVVLLLQSVDSLKQLYTLCMDVHARYRTHAHQKIVPRFNERLLQSLSSCKSCIVIDDQLRVVPHSSHIAEVTALNHHLATAPTAEGAGAASPQLVALKKSVKDTPPVGKLVELCKTLDQAKVVLQFSLSITEKLLRTTVSLTASRGRGKSAAMGLAIAGAISFGYANIYVASPSPENLKTLFEFVEKGLQAVGYENGLHYSVTRSTNDDMQNCVTRISVNRDFKQVVQYITPDQHSELGQAELVVIDEAAAIPLPLIRRLMGPYLVFLSSTVGGYEGTGHSLTLKLIAELKTEASAGAAGNAPKRKLVELTLAESIRYRPNDPVESWLTSLLCLEPRLPVLPQPLPSPDQCSLYYVNRDALFGYHKLSEEFLFSVQSLLASSHYRNSPDDLQQLSDAPAHHLFVLLPPHTDTTTLPPVLVVLQVVLEGGISRASTMTGLMCSDGERPAGDLIPWTVSNVFQNYDFPQLSGGRVLRIAVHPNMQGKGFGSQAVALLQQYYATNTHLAEYKKLAEVSVAVDERNQSMKIVKKGQLSDVGRSSREVGTSPPLLCPIADRPAEPIHYLGAAFGVTQPLLTFWKRAGFTLVYMSQICNKLTGETTVIMLQQLKASNTAAETDAVAPQHDWLPELWLDCRNTLVSSLSMWFRDYSCHFTLGLLTNTIFKNKRKGNRLLVRSKVTAESLERLSSFIRGKCAAAAVSDLLPLLAKLYFCDNIRRLKLKTMQSALLCGLGLLHKSEAAIAEELNLDEVALLDQKRKLISALHDALKPMLEGDDDEPEMNSVDTPTSLAPTKKRKISDGATNLDAAMKLKELAESAEAELEKARREAVLSKEQTQLFVEHVNKRSKQASGSRKKKKKVLDLDSLRQTKKML